MDTENEQEQENGNSGGSTTLITYEVDLTEVQDMLEQQEDTQQIILQELQVANQNIIYGAGVVGALIAMLLGFFCIKELLKVWLE